MRNENCIDPSYPCGRFDDTSQIWSSVNADVACSGQQRVGGAVAGNGDKFYDQDVEFDGCFSQLMRRLRDFLKWMFKMGWSCFCSFVSVIVCCKLDHSFISLVIYSSICLVLLSLMFLIFV